MSDTCGAIPGLLVDDLPRWHGEPPAGGLIRQQPEDFQVEELAGWQPEGEGEHLWLWIEKRGQNTLWVARELARLCGVGREAVSFAGLKDRHALTRQWFSIWLPGRPDPALDEVESIEGVRLLAAGRSRRKIRSGSHLGNRFLIRVRAVQPSPELEARLEAVAGRGVPNYYGEQRFGIDNANLANARRLLLAGERMRNRSERSLCISAARSHLFNQLVAGRVSAGAVGSYLDGDRLMEEGSTELLSLEESRARAAEVENGLLHPTAPLWGRGRALVEGAAAALEADILAPFPDWQEALERLGLKRERRAVRLLPQGFRWQWPEPGVLELAFALPRGCFATSVLRECVNYRMDPADGNQIAAFQ